MIGLALTLRRLAELEHTGPVLIVTDSTSPWQRDLVKLAVGEERLTIHGTTKYKDYTKLRDEWRRQIADPQDGHFYQIHWSALIHEIERLVKVKCWHTILADEAHAAKNRNSQRTLALKRIKAIFKIGVTADPDDNSPVDIWSLLNWLYPARYPAFWRWVKKYVEVFEGVNPKSGKKYFTFGRPLNVEEFRAEIEPFFVRMSLDEIDPGQVPDVFDEIVVEMTPEQDDAYDQMKQWQMTQLGDELVIADYPMVEKMRLQQLAQSMCRAEFRTVWRTVKEFDERGNKVKVRKQVETVKLIPTDPSPKLDALIERLISEPKPTILFSTFPEIIAMACKRMSNAGISYVHVKDNGQLVDGERQFQAGEVDVIAGTTGIMAQSIELNRADRVAFLDVPWNPRVRRQAIGRGKAVGKRTALEVLDIRTKGTVDFLRLPKVRRKQDWKNELLGRKEQI
jgi:SNF2 family DNA or RNA helicase